MVPGSRVAPLAGILDDLPALTTVVCVGEAAGRVGRKLSVDFEGMTAGPATRLSTPTIDLDLACLLYTSGSTGEPKGVMLTHANVRTAIDSIASYLQLTSEDVLMDVLPLSFGYGLTQLFSALKVGARFVLEKGMTFPHVTMTRMASERVTGFAMVPTIAAVILGMDLSKYDLTVAALHHQCRRRTAAGACATNAHHAAAREPGLDVRADRMPPYLVSRAIRG